MSKTTIKLKVVNLEDGATIFEDAKEVLETEEMVESDTLGMSYVDEITAMIATFQASPNYIPRKKKLFGNKYKYDYWMKMESIGEPPSNMPIKPFTRFEKFIDKHTEAPEGWPWINLRAVGWTNLIG